MRVEIGGISAVLGEVRACVNACRVDIGKVKGLS